MRMHALLLLYCARFFDAALLVYTLLLVHARVEKATAQLGELLRISSKAAAKNAHLQ